MRVDASHTEVKRIAVEIDPAAILREIKGKWVRHLIATDPSLSKTTYGSTESAEYVNRDAVWESWYDTGHGSGITTKFRSATIGELATLKAFETVHTVLEELQRAKQL